MNNEWRNLFSREDLRDIDKMDQTIEKSISSYPSDIAPGMIQEMKSTLVIKAQVSKIELGFDKKEFNVYLDQPGGEPRILMMILVYKEKPTFEVGQFVNLSINQI